MASSQPGWERQLYSLSWLPRQFKTQLAFPGLWGDCRENLWHLRGFVIRTKWSHWGCISTRILRWASRWTQKSQEAPAETAEGETHHNPMALQVLDEEVRQLSISCLFLPKATVLLRNVDGILSKLLLLVALVTKKKSSVQEGSENSQCCVFWNKSLEKGRQNLKYQSFDTAETDNPRTFYLLFNLEFGDHLLVTESGN